MKKLFIAILMTCLMIPSAFSYERGDIAYACHKDIGVVSGVLFLITLGGVNISNSYTGCKVRVLESSGGNYRVEAEEYCPQADSSIFWTSWIEPSRSACEN